MAGARPPLQNQDCFPRLELPSGLGRHIIHTSGTTKAAMFDGLRTGYQTHACKQEMKKHE
jgi:hypothetical protein